MCSLLTGMNFYSDFACFNLFAVGRRVVSRLMKFIKTACPVLKMKKK